MLGKKPKFEENVFFSNLIQVFALDAPEKLGGEEKRIADLVDQMFGLVMD